MRILNGFVATSAIVAAASLGLLVEAVSSHNNLRSRSLNNGQGQGQGRRNRQAPKEGYVLTEPCRVAVRDVQCLNDTDTGECGTRYDCEPSLADTDGLGGLVYEIPDDIVRGNEDKIDFSGGTLLRMPGLRIGKDARLEKSIPNAVPGWSRAPIVPPGQNKKTRRLNPTIDDRTVLVVHIKAQDVTTTKTEAELRDDVFGICDVPPCDSVNLRSQYKACSYDQLNFDPMSDTTCAPTANCTADGSGGTPIVHGVTSVVIPNTVSGASDSTIRNAANVALQNQFDVTLPCLSCNNDDPVVLANHIMYCIPPGTSGGWIGYAWYNALSSVYNDKWCTYTSIQMHEIGHNMELAHSGEDPCSGNSCTYGDKSGFMGYSYGQDDQKMCFNAPKNWQLGWYADGHINIDPTSSTKTTQTLYGIANYNITNGASTPVIVRIQTSTNYLSQDYYVSYNRKTGINSNTSEGGNRVLVHKRNRGTGRATSTLLARLANGNEYFVQDNGISFFIRVIALTTSTSPPGTATIEIEEGTLSPTLSPTPGPTSAPTPDCSDGNDCTVDTFDAVTQQCVYENLDCTGNSCTIDTCLNPGGCQNTLIPGCTVGETGQVTLTATAAATVNFRKTSYSKPIVVAFINTRNGPESVAPRVKNVTPSSCEIFMEEPPGTTYSGHSAAELVSYIVMESGRHELAGGLVIEAGTRTTSTVRSKGQTFAGDAISFQSSFPSAPAVLHTLQTHNNGAFMTSLATTITTTGFQIAQEALETGNQNQAVEETIGWIALATGTGTTNNDPYIIGWEDDGTSNGVGQAAYMIDLTSAGFTSVPDIVVSLFGENGGDGSYARGSGTYSLTQQGVFAEEDQTGDSERSHASEPFAWAAFPQNSDLRLPSSPTVSESALPSSIPSPDPSKAPSMRPTSVPSSSPVLADSAAPSSIPSKAPTASPTASPEVPPSASPSTPGPTASPEATPSFSPSKAPTDVPTTSPSQVPSGSSIPSKAPTASPTASPEAPPSASPSTPGPTASPEATPSSSPTKAPTDSPTTSPSQGPSGSPTLVPTTSPFPTPAPTTGSPTPSPSARPSAPPSTVDEASPRYLACGGSQNCFGQTAIAMPYETHEVRCCRDQAKSGWTKYSACPYNVWGESILKALPDAPSDGCYHAETYSSAAAICTANDGRLCTKQELLSDCSRGSGCSHDRDLIWSSSEVVPTAPPSAAPTIEPTTASPTVSIAPSSSPTSSPSGIPTSTSSPTAIGALGETGRVAVSDLGSPVETWYVYANPVVVAFINTRNGDESVDVRVKDVTSRSFKLFLEGSPSLDGEHTDEEVSYIVMEEGKHELDGGLVVQAGRHATSCVHRGGQSFVGDQVDFDTPFAGTPAVLATLNTYNNGEFMSSLTTDVKTTDFEICQEALETDSDVASETIGWMAFETGVNTTSGGSPYIAGYAVEDAAKDGVGETGYTIDLAPAGFADLPDLVVNVYGEKGTDGSYARGAGTFNAVTQTVFAEEDVEKDSERGHLSEPFAWVGFGHNTFLFGTSQPLSTAALGCKLATEECEASIECCSGECFGDGKCM